jgi:cytochrome c5
MTRWQISLGNFTRPLIFLPYSAEELAKPPAPPPIDEDRTCTLCGVTKDIQQFARRGLRLDGSVIFRHTCKKCHAEKRPKRGKANAEVKGG